MIKLALVYTLMSFLLLLTAGCAHLGIYRLELQALPRYGPAPLMVNFNARITGGLDTSPELYCETQTWEFGDGQRVTIFGMCPAWEPGAKIDRQLQLAHTYQQSGTYEAKVSYGPLESQPVQIKVME